MKKIFLLLVGLVGASQMFAMTDDEISAHLARREAVADQALRNSNILAANIAGEAEVTTVTAAQIAAQRAFNNMASKALNRKRAGVDNDTVDYVGDNIKNSRLYPSTTTTLTANSNSYDNLNLLIPVQQAPHN